jgi:hypothetical protein
MAQPASPSMSLQDAPPHDHRVSNHMKSDPDVPIDPSIAQQQQQQQQSPTYPPPYSPYNPQAHEMAQYQGHPPPGMYQPRPDGWGGQYGHPAHMQGPYQSPATSVPNASPNVTAGGRSGQVCFALHALAHRRRLTAALLLTRLHSGLFVRSHPRCAAAQAAASSIRRNRANVQVRLARV